MSKSIAALLHEEADIAEHREYHQRCQVIWDVMNKGVLNGILISRMQFEMDRVHQECSDALGRRLRRMTVSIRDAKLLIEIEPYTPPICLTIVLRHDFNC